MANVVDPNSWRMIPLPDSQPPRHPSEPVAPRVPAREAAGAVVAAISSALATSFDAQRDRVLWNLTPDSYPQPRTSGQRVRVDQQHELAAPAASDHFAESTRVPDASKPWLVLVEGAGDLRKQSQRFRSAAEEDARLLIIVCEMDVAARVDSRQPVSAAKIASNLNCDYVGPLTAIEGHELADALERVKKSGRPTVIYLDARGASTPPPHFSLADHARKAEPLGENDRLRHRAAEALSELASRDRRVAAFSTDIDPLLPTVWETIANDDLLAGERIAYSIEHCAKLAQAGGRPFLFLSLDEALNHLGDIRRAICSWKYGVTLVVESRQTTDLACGVSSAHLAGMRQLPNTSVLSPKDGTELCQMLRWCAVQSGPAIVWLPEEREPPVSWPRGTDIELGRAERLGPRLDVAIVAWGPQAAAAAIAAENLSQRGIGATVVNARFAQPLDVDTLVEVCCNAAYVVIVDDAPAGGGFASWVSEQLIRQGVAQNMTIVSSAARRASSEPDNLHDRNAAAIVARCEWLADPVMRETSAVRFAPLSTRAATLTMAANSDGWQEHVGRHTVRTARDRSQVLAKQLSPDVQAWVAAYEEVGPRDVYLWKWCAHGVELTTLPCVSPEFRAHVCDTKVLSIVLCVLLDDVADEHGNEQLLDVLLEMTCRNPSSSLRGLDAVETRHAEITRELWTEYWARVATYPCHAEYEPVLRYDLLQFQNTMRYSHLVNERPYLLNVAEHDLYTSHNMMMISFATLDLMCSPLFSRQDIGALREAVWHAQCMGRNGNLLSTWRRELANRDFTSGVFARAIMEGDLTHDELAHGDLAWLEAMIRDRGHEAYFFQKWLEHRQRCHACARRVASIDLRGVLEGHDRFLAMHLASEGLI